ncbi:hypothetical protein FRY97_09415 [Phaeodactylibacter luteus]|uniref:Uncharacterized protein n=1 Tax=Phaeodactylibacter luteus TaxID=1564516 RepID=A0A5C6RMK6_9BACT|nr:hypothetical protein FRY97_09415 [Phaeodactylibacter luteus]
MKKVFLSLAFLHLAFAGCAQAGLLDRFNANRLHKQKVSMLILGSWAAGNIALGGIAASQTSGEARYFHGMNAGWNLVNLGLATAGYLAATRTDPASLGLFESIEEQHRIQKIFLFNAGLDVGYMAGGAYLMERARRGGGQADRLRGFGKSIILQGAFLFVFDLGAYLWQANGNAELQPLLQGLSFSGQSVGLKWAF